MDDRLFEATEDRFKPLVGKWCQCIDKHGKKRVGRLNFAGINHKLHKKFQVTLSRCPIWPVDPDTLKEHNNENNGFD